jgi:hypothetical protein
MGGGRIWRKVSYTLSSFSPLLLTYSFMTGSLIARMRPTAPDTNAMSVRMIIMLGAPLNWITKFLVAKDIMIMRSV